MLIDIQKLLEHGEGLRCEYKYTSNCRNKQIVNLFKESGDMEKYGTGIYRVCKEFNEHGLIPPAFENFQHGTMVTALLEKLPKKTKSGPINREKVTHKSAKYPINQEKVPNKTEKEPLNDKKVTNTTKSGPIKQVTSLNREPIKSKNLLGEIKNDPINTAKSPEKQKVNL